MDAVLRVFKRVTGLSTGDGDNSGSDTVNAAAAASFCSIRLLVASSQAINLIGKQGSVIKSIQENSGATVRVLPEDESPSYATSDERIVEIHGETMKVFNALEAVIGHLRKFLVDHSMIPIFEKINNATISQDRTADAQPDKAQPSFYSSPARAPQIGISSDYSLSLKRDPSLYDPESYLDPKIAQSGLSLYGHNHSLGGLRPTGLGRTTAAIVTQMTQTMQVPLSYAEDIIGVGGSNIAYIRRNSGAILTIQESRGLPEEITVEIKGTTAQVQAAQHLIQEFISIHKEPVSSMYGKMDSHTGDQSGSGSTNTTEEIIAAKTSGAATTPVSKPEPQKAASMLPPQKAEEILGSGAGPKIEEVELPSCFMRVPTEIKLKFLESLPFADIAKMGRVCAELRSLSSDNALWKQKFEEEFGSRALQQFGRGAVANWKEKFAWSWKANKVNKIVYRRRSIAAFFKKANSRRRFL